MKQTFQTIWIFKNQSKIKSISKYSVLVKDALFWPKRYAISRESELQILGNFQKTYFSAILELTKGNYIFQEYSVPTSHHISIANSTVMQQNTGAKKID